MQGLLKQPLDFMLAGNACFTLKSNKTGTHFTYKVKRFDTEDKRVLWFVSVLTGQDNENDYTYVGMLEHKAGIYTVRRTAKSRIGTAAPSFMAITWALKHMSTGSVPDTLQVYHEGRCGRCGRKLTVPESIESGFGPECIKLQQ